jgi:putative transposase
METRRVPLEPNHYYHIYNRGINGQDIFFEAKNYPYFLEKYTQYVYPYVETYAYCLLRNHFHLLIRCRAEEEVMANIKTQKAEVGASWYLSNAFASLFKSYAQSINKGYGRTGGLFEEPFHRIDVDNDAYFSRLVWYIHHNPQKHGFVSDFRVYPHSSYQSHLLNKPSKLQREKVLDWFGGTREYVTFHQIQEGDCRDIKSLLIEFD